MTDHRGAIENLLYTYAEAIDAGDYEAIGALFAHGAIADADMPTLLQAVLQRHDDELAAFIANDLQTNEVWRAARLIAAAHSLKAYNGSDFIASKLGASAGLNLVLPPFRE